MITKLEQLLAERAELKEKLENIDNIRNPLQKRFTYVNNRISTIKVRENKKKVK